jgi:hypothetical protein
MNNIVEAIVKARELAIKEGIRANTVLIDEEFARVLPFGIENNIYPPMICGLKAEICKDIPEEMGIVVFESDMREKELVEVVRCSKCKYGGIDDPDFPNQYLCRYDGCRWNKGEHFCGYGKPRMDGE